MTNKPLEIGGVRYHFIAIAHLNKAPHALPNLTNPKVYIHSFLNSVYKLFLEFLSFLPYCDITL